jgi:hypothetical protein
MFYFRAKPALLASVRQRTDPPRHGRMVYLNYTVNPARHAAM